MSAELAGPLLLLEVLWRCGDERRVPSRTCARARARDSGSGPTAPSPRQEKRPRKADRPRCGARCRTKGGAPCSAPVVVLRGPDGGVVTRNRCRMHGGLSTGPKTAEGWARALRNLRQYQPKGSVGAAAASPDVDSATTNEKPRSANEPESQTRLQPQEGGPLPAETKEH